AIPEVLGIVLELNFRGLFYFVLAVPVSYCVVLAMQCICFFPKGEYYLTEYDYNKKQSRFRFCPILLHNPLKPSGSDSQAAANDGREEPRESTTPAGTARLWYENNEENLSSWEKFQEQLKIAFGSTELFIKQAERELKNRAQKTGASTQSYIQSVLELYHKVNPKMTENEKVSHLMKGVAEDLYRSLLVKDISCTSDFIKECQRIEEMNQTRIAKHRFTRLPNVVPVASIGEHEDLKTLIRHIVREEAQRMLAPAQQNTQLESPSVEEVIREEVQQALCPVLLLGL
ncbi:CCHC-type domain-containing protein, partial [Trichonephila clavata]